MNAAARRPALDRVAIFVGSGFGSGRLPWAPGTWGSAAAMLLVAALSFTGLHAGWTLLILAAGTALLCIPIGTRVERSCGRADPPSFVLDEFAGCFIAAFCPGARWPSPGALVAAFLLFRLFDVWKPPPLRALQRLHGGLGIVLDDVGAGLYALLCVAICRGVLDRAPW
jgi:phosphatidylglycerophosphatase A